MSQDFKSLKAKWYLKLKQSGFEDIEDTESPKEYLKQWDDHYFRRRHDAKSFKEQARYFQQRTYFATSYTFKTRTEERAWFLHSEGLSYREIGKELKVTKDIVYKIIKRLTKVMRGY